MIIENVMKVGDISNTEIDPNVISFLQDHCRPAYRDQRLQEHLYDIPTILEDIEQNHLSQDWYGQVPTPEVKNDLKKIAKMLRQTDCAYLRITY
jgi:hypothetical protein